MEKGLWRCKTGVFTPYDKGLGTMQSVLEHLLSIQVMKQPEDDVHQPSSGGCLCTVLHLGNPKLEMTVNCLASGIPNLQYFFFCR